eukprot:CAMPEP_0197540218 /NCGR_PEP_ID=MMETSP1318-20131121/65132_1 /TAXON_ID=552666 /ORGANISM="Partenskyella glossopodia, Strain RCC365" /LENGTH=122 /DNA_ID=CAMNT_0043099143 /DNA_START=105 /DNA_END=469 /DNA_ORIENTATION=+
MRAHTRTHAHPHSGRPGGGMALDFSPIARTGTKPSSRYARGVLPYVGGGLPQQWGTPRRQVQAVEAQADIAERLDPQLEEQFWSWAESRGIKASDRLRLAKYDGVIGLQVAKKGETRSGDSG